MNTIKTLYSFVNPWECDENDHLNVQFYYGRFEEADRQFQLMTGLNESLVGGRRVRYVRYHRELRAADLVTISSHIAFDGPHMLTVVHEMRNPAADALVATAMDGYEPSTTALKTIQARLNSYQAPMLEAATPVGLPVSPFAKKPTATGLLDSGAQICFLGTVLPRHLGVENRADDKFALSCFTDGVAHVWERTPMTHVYLSENGLGRVAVEMKLTWVSPLKSGDPVKVITGLTGASDKTFTMRHHLFEARTDRLAAVCDVVALMMDLKKRKAVPLPEGAKKTIMAMAID